MGYLGSSVEDSVEAAILGVPYEMPGNFRNGSRFGPHAIRAGSDSLESYSPFLHRDLLAIDYMDLGDVDFSDESASMAVEKIANRTELILSKEMFPILLGGEHLVTLGSVKALKSKFPDLHILYLGAHANFRNEFNDEQLHSSTVTRRIAELVLAERTYRLGIRSGTQNEMESASLPPNIVDHDRNIEGVLESLPGDAPLYITLSMDVFDPSLVPGVNNPVPLGLTYREFIQLVRVLCRYNIVGFDVVELSPEHDPTGISSIVAASVVRELLLSLFD